MIADKLMYGDEIRVIAPSSSLSRVRKDIYDKALAYLEAQGFKITFSKNSREMNEFKSSEIKSRVEDIHEAFRDKNVKMIITCIGGHACIEVFCGSECDGIFCTNGINDAEDKFTCATEFGIGDAQVEFGLVGIEVMVDEQFFASSSTNRCSQLVYAFDVVEVKAANEVCHVDEVV